MNFASDTNKHITLLQQHTATASSSIIVLASVTAMKYLREHRTPTEQNRNNARKTN